MVRFALCVFGLALAAPAHGAIIASWNFNDADLSPDLGAGALTTNFSSVNYVTGTTVNALPLIAAGNALRLQANSNKGQYLTIEVDTTSLEDIIVSLAWRRNSGGFDNNQVSWSTDGVDFTAVQNNLSPPLHAFGAHVVDFSSIPEMDNNASVYVRVELNGAGNEGGHNYLDNIQVEGTPMPVPSPAGAGAPALAGLGVMRRRR